MANIRVGCATLVIHDNKLLLGKRGKEPAYGKLIIPSGGVDLYENLIDTAKREIKEETNINIKNLKQFVTYQIINPEKENHRVIVFWKAEYESGTLLPSSDLLTAKFYNKDEIKNEISAGNIDGIVLEVLKDAGWC